MTQVQLRSSVPSIDRFAYVLYGGQPDLWHQRLVLGTVAQVPGEAVISSPDWDMYGEKYDYSNNDIMAVRFAPIRRPPPAGLQQAPLHGFRRGISDRRAAELLEAAREVALEIFARAHPRAAAPPGGALIEMPVGGLGVSVATT